MLLVLFFYSFSSIAQTEDKNTKFINSVEASFEAGFGGGTKGLQVKVNHYWINNETFILQSGVSLTSFHGSEKAIIIPNTTTKGYNFDTHLRFYTGVQHYFSKKRKGFYTAEAYGGSYHIYTKGNVTNTTLSIDSDYKSNTILGDFGIRIGYGYQINERLGLTFSITNSWRQIGSDHGALIRFLSMEPDAKTSIGIGVNYSL